jgi:flagellar assembly protein FliH
MSPRARVLREGDVESFAWGRGPEEPGPGPRPVAAPARPAVDHSAAVAPAPAPSAPSPLAPSGPAAPVPSDESVAAEHQARLAALERDAFTKGYASGERAGLEAGGKRAEAMLRRVAQTIEELSGLRQTLIHETEREMAQLALTLARRIVHREVSLDPELAAALAHVALERLGTSTPATIRMNPADYTVVAQDGGRWGTASVTVVPDPSISRGGCLVETEFGSVDATIERQFDELSRALLGDH